MLLATALGHQTVLSEKNLICFSVICASGNALTSFKMKKTTNYCNLEKIWNV